MTTYSWITRCACGEEAEARLVYVRNEGGVEEGHSLPKCHWHLIKALDVWDKMKTTEVHVVVASL